MKKIGLLFMLFVFSLTSGFSVAQSTKNKQLTAYLQLKQFYAPEIGNYVELHFQYVGYTISYLRKGNDLMGELAVIIKVTQDGKEVASDAYRLNTPLMIDGIVDDFYDIKRFALTPGNYQCNVELMDLNSKNASIKTNFQIGIDDFSDALSISDILVAESANKSDTQTVFTKSGYDILPRIATFYPRELTNLPIYFEVYNSNLLEDPVFTIRQQLINTESSAMVPQYTSFYKYDQAPVVPVFKSINIADLPTGKYKLSMTIFDKKSNKLSAQDYEFERANDLETEVNFADMVLDPAFQQSITDDSVRYYLASLVPISNQGQARTILREVRKKNTDKEMQRKLIQAIWKQIDPVNTFEAWMKYKTQVRFVENNFKNNFQPGFETDRGRVYLQYGAPNRTIEREVSASELPYEIWEYNKVGKYSNKKFIFYNPDLVNNNYRLLHSDMIGELNNPNWRYELNRRDTKHGNVDNPNEYIPDSWGNNSKQLFGE
ncbi:MAG: GWxTD domain-containing protein [Crocinitomicaceae bacterium]|nr:GWxTD domain-containing protein [Crocinitomicaceae bacterium]